MRSISSAPTSTERQLELAGRLLDLHPGVLLQSHVAENADEVRWVAELFPWSRSYLDVYARAGLLHPRSVLAHGIWLDADDRAALRGEEVGLEVRVRADEDRDRRGAGQAREPAQDLPADLPDPRRFGREVSRVVNDVRRPFGNRHLATKTPRHKDAPRRQQNGTTDNPTPKALKTPKHPNGAALVQTLALETSNGPRRR